jgi:hypothetical protein
MSDLHPEHEPLDDFDRITTDVPVVSAWQAMWNWAEETLATSRFSGFNVEDIGRLAFDSLPEGEKEEALDALFYTYWSATMADRETRAAQAGGAA